jgi:salicylate hydroxylase
MRIAIVGGGIGGLAAALFLSRAGLAATVYEQAATLREVGAGIVVGPNMARLIAALGLLEPFEAIAVRLEAAWEFRRWQDGRVLGVQPMGEACRSLYGAHCYVVHRAELHTLLREALPAETLRTGRRCTGMQQATGADVAEIEFALAGGGTQRVAADVVIGADGIHSLVREHVAPAGEARFSGLCAFRSLVPANDAPPMALRPVQTLWLGPGRHFVHYPISSGRFVNLVAIVPAGDWRDESWLADGTITDMRAEFPGWDERVHQLITSATVTKRWAMFDRTPLPNWTRGRVTLLGDAAHAMLPFFAQGAAQAFEDAAVLAACLRAVAPADASAALERYETLRRPRASQVQMLSRGREVQNHLPDGPEQQARDARLASDEPLRQSAWLYGHEVMPEVSDQSLGPSPRGLAL